MDFSADDRWREITHILIEKRHYRNRLERDEPLAKPAPEGIDTILGAANR